MIIRRLEAFPLSAPFAVDAPAYCFRPAAHFQDFPRRGQDAVLVQVSDDDGLSGWGEAWGLPVPNAAAACINDWLAPCLIGTALESWPTQWDAMAAHLANLGHAAGCGFDALSGIDMACCDLLARRAGMPLSRWLGGAPRVIHCYAAPVPFYATTDETVASAVALLVEGHDGIKLKIGRGCARDVADVAAVRSAIGDQVRLMVDANGAYDEATAIDVARAIAPFTITWFEDPLCVCDPAGYARIRGRSGVPVATGENLHGLQQFTPLIDAVDVLVVNIARIGGFTGLRRLRDRTSGTSTTVSFHGVGTALMQAATLHAAAAWFSDAWIEWNVFPNALRNTVVDALPQRRGAWCSPPEGNGLGCTVVDEALTYFAVRNARRA